MESSLWETVGMAQRRLRIVKYAGETALLGVCEYCNKTFESRRGVVGPESKADIGKQFDEHGHLRAPIYMPRRTRKHAQRRKSPGSKLKNKEGADWVSRRPPAGHWCFSLHIAAKPETVPISPLR